MADLHRDDDVAVWTPVRRAARVSWWVAPLAVAALASGCAPQLSQERQQCMECALRAHTPAADARQAVAKLSSWCLEGDMSSCSALGVAHLHGRGLAADRAAAMRLFRHACQNQNPAACVHLGRLLATAQPAAETAGPVDHAGAELLFETACLQDEPDGCYELGVLRIRSGATASGVEVLTRACDADHAGACEQLGMLHDHGRGVSRDAARARQLYLQACGQGNVAACERVRPARASL